MNKGLIKIQWEQIEKYSDEEITYYLYLEGKNMESLSKIRNLDRVTIEKHIIEGKIKYRHLAKSKDAEELFFILAQAGKEEKINVIRTLDEDNKYKLLKWIQSKYIEMLPKEKETAVWIIGEAKEVSYLDILIKASVHKHVNIRRMAISALGKLGDKRGEAALLRALEDENPQVILYAIKALSKIESEKSQDKIEKIYTNSSKEYLRSAAEDFLQKKEIVK